MNEKIVEFSYRRLAEKKRAFPLFITLMTVSFALAIVSMFIPKYSGVVSLVAMGTITAATLVYVRYIASDYTYSVREGSDGRAYLLFTKIIGKRQSMMANIPLYSVKSIERFTKSELKQQKIDRGACKYNFAPSLTPDVVYVIKAEANSVKYNVIIEGTEELRARLLEYVSYARLDEMEKADEE